jgi:hypothetical protein
VSVFTENDRHLTNNHILALSFTAIKFMKVISVLHLLTLFEQCKSENDDDVLSWGI